MRIAIVEDNEVFQLNYVGWLNQLFPTATIDQFADASRKTKEALLAGSYNLVILDIQLGERRLGGRALAADLHVKKWSLGEVKPVVVVLTATIEPELVPTIEAQGVALVRGKPLTQREMEDVLQRIGGLAKLMTSKDVPSSAVHIDLTAMGKNVFRGELKERLSAVPLRMLERLLRTPDVLVRYEDFEGCSAAPLSRESIHQHIRTIRSTLEALYSEDELKALPMNERLASIEKQGYRWGAPEE